MTFKEQLKADISGVFINQAEFAAVHAVNGEQMPVILDDNELLERDKAKAGTNFDGLYKSRRLMFVEKSIFGPRPAIGATLALDGKMYRVQGCTEETGMLAIEIEAVKS